MKRALTVVLLILTLSITTAAIAQDESFPWPPKNTGEAKSGETKSKDTKSKETVPAPPPASADSQYVIGKEDVLSVQVWREPELTRQVTVRPDGNISMPLVGEVIAAGKTPLELQKILTDLLAAYMTAPEVSVIVQDTRSQRFSIIGQVMHPGTFPLSKPMTVLDALALAGGFRDFAKSEKMYILRMSADGNRERIPVSYKKIISVKGTSQNVELQVRDTLVVP
jgi:polysaccharide export outer membrane protein